MLQEKLSTLKRELVFFGNMVEEIINKSMRGIVERKTDLLNKVINEEESRADEYESKLDEMCTNLIAQFEPKAKDLRAVLMIYKINKDLERMADHAVNIAESGIYIASHPPLKHLIDIPRMAEMSSQMLRESITSFIQEDAGTAKAVVLRDDDIDHLWEQLFRELVTFMIADPANIERALNLIRIAHNLERIADLATNIGEDVIFMVEGKDIKHHLSDGKPQ